ncbi:MAG: hypothetical protein M3436_11350 [Pseudomonadota bacterium]|nr:hypothetical protein [Pseudomonadota bacterium]
MAGAILTLVAFHLVTQAFVFLPGDSWAYGFVPLFHIGRERNVPTLYSALSLAACAMAFFRIAVAEREEAASFWAYWMGLAVVFAWLAIDEALRIHERTIEPLRAALKTSGVLYYAWIIPYGLFAIGFGAVYLRFLFGLPRRVAALFVTAGAVFLAGAVGCEMLGGREAELHGRLTVVFAVYVTVEEILEMTGIALLADAIQAYLEWKGRLLRVDWVAFGPILRPRLTLASPP